MPFNNILILSPHPDDEALGCGGLITNENYCQIHVRYYNTIHPSANNTLYNKERCDVAKIGKFESSLSPLVGVNRLDLYPIAEFITDIENIINEIKPDTLLIPDNSHNQDHRVIYQAAITASRIHDTNWFISNILVYEQTEYMTNSFIPSVYVPINIEKKLDLYNIYQTQQRGHRTHDHIRFLAGLRGMQCGVPYAEAYMPVRMMF